MSGLYIHIPFCRKKCAYCDFVSFAGCEQDAFEQYFKALFREIDLISPMLPKKEFETLFIGGGTPSLLPSGMIPRLAAKLCENFVFPADAEISIECNPESVSLEKLVQYRACGINRISFGLQSADDAVLKAVGRIHTAADFSVHLSLHGRQVSTTSMLISCTAFPDRVSNLILTRYGARRNSGRNTFHPMLSFLPRERPCSKQCGTGQSSFPTKMPLLIWKMPVLTCSAALATSVMKYPTLPFPAANAAII